MPLIDMLCHKFPDISRKELFARILCGEVYVDNEKIYDKRRPVKPSSHIELKYKEYVSRGGIKLAHVLQQWNINVKDKVCIDAGSSTGGFTDCLLQHGTAMVHAIDVGYNQLAYSLRKDTRVKVYERTNIMNVEENDLVPKPHIAAADLSFRSIHGVAGHILDLVDSDALIALIKPQFEWENPDPGFNGIIYDKQIILTVCEGLIYKLYAMGVFVSRVALSPISGIKGNTELFFLLHKKTGEKKRDILGLLASLLQV